MTLAELLRKYLDDELTPDEVRLFREAALRDPAGLDKLLTEWIDQGLVRAPAGEGDIDFDVLYEEMAQRHAIRAGGRRGLRLFLFIAAAAACLLAVAGIFLLHRSPSPKPAVVKAPAAPPVIIPAGNKAVLTLANGSRVTLDSAADGLLAKQGGVLVVKLAGGQLAYKAPKPGTVLGDLAASGTSAPADDRPLYNEIATPRGGFYELLLPDGSKVWLDAASSLRFPTAFNGPSRQVDLTGEAYFEVAPNPRQPFLINTQGVTVQVLGTELNLMAYSDEDAIRTTLVSGSVRVLRGGKGQQIKPGEQASWLHGAQGWQVSTPDMKQVLAWKRLEFRFEGLSMDAIMRQIARWYDVDIEYRGPLPAGEFNGVISRKKSVADLLAVLEQTDIVHFSLEGRKIVVERRL